MKQELILWKDEADKLLTSKKNERKDTFIKIIDGKAVITTDIGKLQKPIWKVLKPVFLKSEKLEVLEEFTGISSTKLNEVNTNNKQIESIRVSQWTSSHD